MCMVYLYLHSLTIVYDFRLLMFIFDHSSGLGHMDLGPVNSDVLHSQTEHKFAYIDLSQVSFYLHYITLCLFNILVVFSLIYLQICRILGLLIFWIIHGH